MRRHRHLVLLLVAAGASVGTSTTREVAEGPRWEATATLSHAEALGEGQTWPGEISFSARPPLHGQMWGGVTLSPDPVDDINDFITLRVEDAAGFETALLQSPPAGVESTLRVNALDSCVLGRPCEAASLVVMQNVRGATVPRLTAVAAVYRVGARSGSGSGQDIKATLVDLGTSAGSNDTGEDTDTAKEIDSGDSADNGGRWARASQGRSTAHPARTMAGPVGRFTPPPSRPSRPCL